MGRRPETATKVKITVLPFLGKDASNALDGIDPNIRAFGRVALGMTPTGHLLSLARGFKVVAPGANDIGITAQIDNLGAVNLSHSNYDSNMCYQIIVKHSSFRHQQ